MTPNIVRTKPAVPKTRPAEAGNATQKLLWVIAMRAKFTKRHMDTVTTQQIATKRASLLVKRLLGEWWVFISGIHSTCISYVNDSDRL